MPSIPLLLRNTIRIRYDIVAEPSTSMSNPLKVWIIIAVVLAIIVLMALVVYITISYYKRRQYRKALEKDPYLSRKEFFRRRKLSAADLEVEEEKQRAGLIRKSLASQSSKSLSHIDVENLEVEEERGGKLKDEWKEWEAKLMKEQTSSHKRHPSLSSLPDLPAPAQTRSRSPSRSPLLEQQQQYSPPLHQLPEW